MILLKQYPLNGVNTFEDELLLLLNGTLNLICGYDGSKSIISGDICQYSYFQACKSPVDMVSAKSICKIFKKYNKTLKGLFEIRLTKNSCGRWLINIKENMTKPSEEITGYVR